MGSATMQGKLWGARPREWAAYGEQLSLPLFGAVLDTAHVTNGSRYFDAGCGAGLLALLASLRGAQVTCLDASASLLEVARDRLPNADIREGDLEELPFADASFDAITAVNSLFYAADMYAATRELARVARPGGRVVATAWGQSDFLSTVFPALAPLMPPLPPGATPPKPGALSEPGALARLLEDAGLRVVDDGTVAAPIVFPSHEISWKAHSSAGPNRVAIEHSGEEAVHAVYEAADRAHTRPDGTIRYESEFLWVAAVRA